MPKVSQEYLDLRRSEILDAAIVCFSRDGFAGTTMKDIVRQSGLSPGAIYNYFKSKEEIIEAIASRRQAKERELAMEVTDESSAGMDVERVLAAFLNELENPRERLRRRLSIQLWAEAQRNPRVRKIVLRSFEQPRKLLSEVFVASQKAGALADWVDPGTLASFVIATFHGLVLQREWDDQFSVERHKTLLHAVVKAVTPDSF